jgi:hypothetical protein
MHIGLHMQICGLRIRDCICKYVVYAFEIAYASMWSTHSRLHIWHRLHMQICGLRIGDCICKYAVYAFEIAYPNMLSMCMCGYHISMHRWCCAYAILWCIYVCTYVAMLMHIFALASISDARLCVQVCNTHTHLCIRDCICKYVVYMRLRLCICT